MNVLLIITAGLFEVSAVAYMCHKGIRVVFLDLRDGINRIIEGPPQRDQKETIGRDCFVIHRTADLELECYGKIVSNSIADHLNTCHMYSHSNSFIRRTA